MNAVRQSFLLLLRMVKRDAMLFAVCPIPLLVGILFRFALPALEKSLTAAFNRTAIFAPYYGLFDSVLSMLAPTMFCFVAAMVLLEETDLRLTEYLLVTPLGKHGYLLSRLGLPCLAAGFFTLLLLAAFSLTALPALFIGAMSLVGAIQGLLLALIVIVFSTNKLEGLAITKLASLLLLGAFAPFFLDGSLRFLLSPLPSFWLAFAVQQNRAVYFLPALLLSVIWMLALLRRFLRKVSLLP